METAARKYVFEPHLVDAVATWAIYTSAFTVPVVMFVKQEVDKCSHIQSQIDIRYKRLANAVDDHEVKGEVGFQPVIDTSDRMRAHDEYLRL